MEKLLGNYSTNLPIDKFFETDITTTSNIHYTITVKTDDDPIYITILDKVLRILRDKESRDIAANQYENVVNIDWDPNSHMRDDEILEPYELVIDTYDGIGVIILEAICAYIKLYSHHDDAKVVYTRWEHSPTAKKVLASDLSFGYDVLLVKSNNKIHHLCESYDYRDGAEYGGGREYMNIEDSNKFWKLQIEQTYGEEVVGSKT